MADFAQFTASGLTRGAIYALVGMGFAIIYNASNIINFAQGEFVMLGGMLTAFLFTTTGLLPIWLAVPVAIAAATIAGVAFYRLAIEPAQRAGLATLIIITIGGSVLLRGIVEVTLGKREFVFPAFSGESNVQVLGASIASQSLWVLGTLAIVAALLWWFFEKTLFGKAMRATAQSPLAAQLVGIETRHVLLVSFALAAALGALGGVLTTPITLTRYDIGIMLGLKGFAATMLGGLGNPFGALAGGLVLGLVEAFTGGYVSSGYQDAIAFLLILTVLMVRPGGLFGRVAMDRV
ncbi:branched-chain amino acid ABC transporter permease [Tardiphaga robiniae]|uniref:branched-chain amino acid ABC transporter permease n=1 Tax=Tardiphaga robiniae TaxID=943830 RepID=UPI00182820A5|nr:branched-chain amino acid ABC transporter permease [Tardiphaga robiniae]NUU42584.1 branched-chain amino acid ABC transporter permease [Tardiphaga robiniae]